MNRLIRFVVVVLLLLLIVALPVHAQSITLSVNPTSGPPGTVVTLSLSHPYSGFPEQCFANSQPFTGKVFTIPDGMQQNTIFTFHCTVGDGEFAEASNSVDFVVTAPLPTQPPQQPTQPPPTQPPQQPTQPPQPQPTQPPSVDPPPVDTPLPQPTQPPPPTLPPLPALPIDGTCYVATTAAAEVNIRAEPTTASAIVGSLNPYQVYSAVSQSFQPDGVWFQLQAGGYVAGFVTRQTPACDDVPLEGLDILSGDEPDEGETQTVQLALMTYDFEALFAECPELLIYLDSIPLHILNWWADYFESDAVAEGDTPCGVMATFIEDILWVGYGSIARDIPPEILDQLMNECPGNLVGWLLLLDTAYRTNPDVYREALSRLPEDICADTDNYLDTLRGFSERDFSAWLDRFAVPLLIQQACGVDIDEATLRTFGVLELIDYDSLIRSPYILCESIEFAGMIGRLSDTERDFHDRLMEACPELAPHLTVPFELFYIIRSQGININSVPIDTSDPSLCSDPWGYLMRYAPDQLVDGRSADIPPQLASCPEDARLLRARNDTLDPYVLLAILNAPDPCHAAYAYLSAGYVPNYTGPALTCDPNLPEAVVHVLSPESEASVEGERERRGEDCVAALLFPLPHLVDRCLRGRRQPTVVRRERENPDEPAQGQSVSVVVGDGDGVVVARSGDSGPANEPDMTLVLADGSVLDERSSWEEKIAAMGRDPEQVCSQPPPRLAPPAGSERICYGVTFALRDDNNVAGELFGPSVGVAVVTNFSDGRASVLETNYQSVNVRRGGSADLSFVAYVTNRTGDPRASYGVDLVGLADLGLVTSTGISHGQVSDELCRNNTPPRNRDFFLTIEPSVSIAVEIPFIDVPAPSESGDGDDTGSDFELDPEPGEVELGDGEPGRVPPPEGEVPGDTGDAPTDTGEAPPVGETGDAGEAPGAGESSDTGETPAASESSDTDEAPGAGEPGTPGTLPGSVPAGPGGLPADVTPVDIDDIPAPDDSLPTAPQPSRLPVALQQPSVDPSGQRLSEALIELNPLFNGRIDGTTAVFQAEQGDQSRLYLLRNNDVVPVLVDNIERLLLPAFNEIGGMIAFIGVESDGTTSLGLHNLYSENMRMVFANEGDLQLLRYRAAWMPNAQDQLLLASLTDGDGRPGIYLFDLIEDDPQPELMVSDAYQPVMALDGLFMAFVRDVNGVPNIFTRALRSGREQAITDQREGDGCHSPTFSNNPMTIYFVCGAEGEGQLYRYNMSGLFPVELPVPAVNRPAAGPIDGFISYDDGTRIYLSTFDGTLNAPLVEFNDLVVTGIHWASTP